MPPIKPTTNKFLILDKEGNIIEIPSVIEKAVNQFSELKSSVYGYGIHIWVFCHVNQILGLQSHSDKMSNRQISRSFEGSRLRFRAANGSKI